MKAKGLLHRLGVRILAVTIFVYLCAMLGNFSYALDNITYALGHNKPDVIITVNPKGKVIYSGDLFGKELWYPGKSKTGVIRIVNNYRDIRVTQLAFKAKLLTSQPEFDRELVYGSFLKNMKLTITQGKLLIFNFIIVDNMSLAELRASSDNGACGLLLNQTNQLNIGYKDSLDLRYDLGMDEKAGEELESIKALVSFVINFE